MNKYKRQLDTPKAMLIMDNAPSHPDLAIWSPDDGPITCLFLPPNTTSLLQPMDECVLQPMDECVLQPMDECVLQSIKQSYKCYLLLRMLNEDDETNVAEFGKKINIKDAVLLSAKCWNDVQSDAITKSWKNLLINPDQITSEEMNGLDSPPSEVRDLLDQFDPSATDKGTWLSADSSDSGYQELTHEEIVSKVNENEAEDDEDDDAEDDNSPPTSVTHNQACGALETVLKYVEHSSLVCL